jgi:2,3-bisphosphoglycerate-independent phosphoglycerate mutase
MQKLKQVNKIILFILDGFATGDLNNQYNAFAKTDLPFLKPFISKYQVTQLEASGTAIGLPERQIGSSEVGHLTIGSGRVLKQSIQNINDTITKNSVLQKIIQNPSTLHIIGLTSHGGVHSSVDHLKYILNEAKNKNPSKIIHLHIITDGRDTKIDEAKTVISEIQSVIQGTNIKISTVSGRYFAMDRDSRWDRIGKFYNALINKNTHITEDSLKYIAKNYEKNIFDEFIEPCVLEGSNGVKEDDELLFFNFRADRMRQIVSAICDKNFNEFKTQIKIDQKNIYTFTDFFSKKTTFKDINVVFEKQKIINHLSEIYSNLGLSQLKIAETEKYAHVTFFFNAEKDTPFPNEDRILIPSPKIKSYDMQPEMSLDKMEEELIKSVNSQKYDLIVCNVANCDMVGHTGNFLATQKALITVDKFLAKIDEIANKKNYTIVLTADHGNIDDMYDVVHGQPNTKHSLALVPFCINISNLKLNEKIKIPSLANVAPTILKLANIEKPNEMTDSLI